MMRRVSTLIREDDREGQRRAEEGSGEQEEGQVAEGEAEGQEGKEGRTQLLIRRAAVVAVAAALAAVSCSSEKAAEPTPTASSVEARVVLHAYNVVLDPTAEPGSETITFIVHAAKWPLHVVVTGPDVDICPVPPPEGETPPCEHRKVADVRAEGVVIKATEAPAEITEIAVSYEPADRSARVELPTIPPRPGESVCKDACNPVVELTPFTAGRLTASATWEGIATGALIVETGGMSEHAYTELGRPYEHVAQKEASSDQGAPDLEVTATVTATEAGVALESRGARPLLKPALEVTWP